MPRVRKPSAPEPIQPEPVETLTAQFDSDLNAVIFTVNGIKLAIREPTALDFMNLEAWLRSPSNDEVEELQKRDVNFLLIKLTSLCSIAIEGETKAITYKDLCAALIRFEDVEATALAVGYFRDSLADYFKRIGERAAKVGS